jgi:hypothetical protein
MGGLAPGGGVLDALARAYRVQMQRNAVNAQDQPVPPVDTTGIPARTQNAVAGAEAAQSGGKQATTTPATPALPDASRVAVPSGPVSGRAPNANVPYPDFTRAAPRASSSPVNIEDRMPDLKFAQAPQFQSSRDVFDPNLFTQLQELDFKIGELSNSKGLADSWRRSQLRKARTRLVGDSAMIAKARTAARDLDIAQFGAQVNAMRAANEIPLAQLSDFTQRRGQTLTAQVANMRDATERYGIDTRDATERYGVDTRSTDLRRGQDFELMARMPQVALGAELVKLQQSGAPLDDVAATTEAFGASNPRQPRAAMTDKVVLPSGGEAFVVTQPDGRTRVMLPEELLRLGKLPRQNAEAGRLFPEK